MTFEFDSINYDPNLFRIQIEKETLEKQILNMESKKIIKF
jgi:hypothetical protein